REQAYQSDVAPQDGGQAAPPPPAAAPAAGNSTDTMIDQLKQLAELKDQGILTDAEFESQKAKLLAV
ncbi:MAG: hypothetical protein JWM47_19, partial [Acidimicrobiales bacterium]|nr:hypothetical protein [Acidimicrobiales bacterium]